ncbi:MAG TPA: isoprenylcysteine carboxylmethyltransferase family protein [Gemmataceae bacterium]|nr:isoprenylcysteine carboxylmethyltransferase family protein [Gemmataceae bacterium]
MSGWKMVIAFVAFPAVAGAAYFSAAGRLDLPFAWGVLGVLAVFSLLMFLTTDPGMRRERRRPGPGNRDRLTRPATLLLILAHWIIAGLDAGRFQWSPVPWPVQLAGLIGYALAMAGALWAMRANPFYSSVVRIQADRGQYPVTTGPYRYVRHPGYTFTMLGIVFGGLTLGSWVGMVPVVGGMVLFVHRTLLEDSMLRRELAGYAEYAGRVRYRLVAGVI